MSLGSQIKYYRQTLNMNQAELGEALGVSAQAVSKWENNKAEPDSSTLLKMCDILDIDANTLLAHGNTNSQFRETLYRRPGMRILFDAAKDAPDEVLQKTADLLEAMKNGQVK